MPAIDRRKLPNYNYSPVRGLASLLQGVDQERNRRMVEKQVDWKDPSRPVNPNEANRMAADTMSKGLAYQMAYQTPGNTFSLPQLQQMLSGSRGQISPATGVVQNAPQASAAPTAVNKSGAIFGSLRNQMKQQMMAAQQAGAVGYDDQLQSFVDANGNPV